jgi:hypothetical protein
MTDLIRTRAALLLVTGALLAAAGACDTPPPTDSQYSTPTHGCAPATPPCVY